MKSGTAVLIAIMKELANTYHNIGLMLTSDEEIGGFNGTEALLKQGYTCQAAVLPDGGKAIQNIVYKAKGVLWISLDASGTPAHGSTPWIGESAITRLMRAIDSTQAVFLSNESHPQDHWVATCNIGKIQGGEAVNQVASRAHATCDIRYTELDTVPEILQRITNAMPDGVKAKKILTANNTFTAPDNKFLLAYQESIRSINRAPKLSADHGSSDARFFSEYNIPVIMSQPEGDGHHTDNEWVSITSIYEYYKVVRDFLDRVENLD